MIKFFFANGSEQVLNPSSTFFHHQETKVDYTKWKNGRHPKRVLTVEERVARIAADLGAVDFKIN